MESSEVFSPQGLADVPVILIPSSTQEVLSPATTANSASNSSNLITMQSQQQLEQVAPVNISVDGLAMQEYYRIYMGLTGFADTLKNILVEKGFESESCEVEKLLANLQSLSLDAEMEFVQNVQQMTAYILSAFTAMAGIISGVMRNSSEQSVAVSEKSDLVGVKMEDSTERNQPTLLSGHIVDPANSAEAPSAHVPAVTKDENIEQPSKPFRCGICSQDFACDIDFTSHREGHSQNSLLSEKTLSHQRTQTDVPSEIGSDEECPVVHFENNEQTQSDDGGFGDESFGNGQRGRGQPGELLCCDYCAKMFKHGKQISDHMNMYHSDKIIGHEESRLRESAQHCSGGADEHNNVSQFSFIKRGTVGRSVKNGPGRGRGRPRKSLQCDYCPKVFRLRKHASYHLHKYHSDQLRSSKAAQMGGSESVDAVGHGDGNSRGRKGKGDHQKRMHCDYCSKTFTVQEHFIIHMNRYHKAEIRSARAARTVLENSAPTGNAQNVDSTLGTQDTDVESLPETRSQDGAGQDGSTGELPDSDELGDHDSDSDYQPQQEKHITPQMSKTRFLLNRQSLTCDFCPQIFRTAEQVWKHMQIVHKDELGPHLRVTGSVKQKGRPRMSRMCDYCPKIFTKRASVIVHMRTAHAEEMNWTPKSYLCSECGRSFTTQSILKSHIRRHQNIRSFHCEMCSKSFLTAGDLKDHRRGVHFGIRPFLCTLCGAAFKRQYALQCHMRTHTGQREHTCLICNKAFKERHQLNRHMSLHSSEKPYACQFCQAKYSHKGGLRIHLQRSKACPGSLAVKNRQAESNTSVEDIS